MNVVNDLLHLAFGIWGIIAYRTFTDALYFTRTTAVVYALLAICGLIPVLNTLFGVMPLYGQDVWLHAVIAIVGAVIGFTPAIVHSDRDEWAHHH